jgi:hypothetical protein
MGGGGGGGGDGGNIVVKFDFSLKFDFFLQM